MRLYLSSFRLGNRPDELLRLLAGRKRAAVIGNAEDGKPPAERGRSLARELDDLTRLGLEPVELDLRAYFDGSGDLRDSLSRFDLLWVRGGNVFVLRRALRSAGAEDLLQDLLARDAVVYGGYSAGAGILTPSLRGLELVDDPGIVPSGYEASPIWDGLGVLPYALAPHYRSDHPESAAIDRLVEHLVAGHRLFLALRDGEVLVRDGDRENVLG